MPAHTTDPDYTALTYYRVADGQSSRAIGLVPGTVLAVFPNGSCRVLAVAGVLAHGTRGDRDVFATLLAAGDVERLDVPGPDAGPKG